MLPILVNKFLAMDRADKILHGQAVAWLTFTVLNLRLRGFPGYHRKLKNNRVPALRDSGISLDELERVTGAVRRVSRVLRIGNCLSRSLAAYGMLGRRGIPVQVMVGVYRRERRCMAHAWIEYDGSVVGESLAADFEPFPRAIL